LRGLGSITDFSTWPSWAQAGAVIAVGAVAGYYGRLKLWPMVAPKLGLSGYRRRRR
jgi:hypothetical protein